MFDLTRSIHAHYAATGTGAVKAGAKRIANKDSRSWADQAAREKAMANLAGLSGRTRASHDAAKGEG